MSELAIHGGPKLRSRPFPARNLVGEEERVAIDALIEDALATGEPINYNGAPTKRYEEQFVEWMGGGYARTVNSGTNALFCALGALNLEPLSEVIVPPITDPGGVMLVLFLGCVPVPADGDPRSFNVSVEGIAACITERTRAIVVAHIAGEPADMTPILELAATHGLKVVEDCSQAHGALYQGRKVGTFGDIAAFSTMSGKHYCTGGQGGIVFTRDEGLYREALHFADRGKDFRSDGLVNVRAALNCNLDDFAATIGVCQLAKLPGVLASRRHHGELLKQALAGNPSVRVGWQVPGSESAYWFLRMAIDTERLTCDKEAFCQALAAEGIPVSPRYHNIPAKMPWFREQRVFGNSGWPWQCPAYRGERNPDYPLPSAEAAVAAHFTIACHEKYTENDILDIADAIEKVTQYYLK